MKSVIVTVIAAVFALGLAAPAQARANYQPDAMINPAMVGWIGHDIIGTDGAEQEAYVGTVPGGVVDFELAVENDGIFGDYFTFHGCASKRGFKVHYFAGATNVTSQVINGTLTSVVLSPGGVAGGLHLRVKVTSDSKPMMRCDVVVASTNAPASTDTVRAKVERLV